MPVSIIQLMNFHLVRNYTSDMSLQVCDLSLQLEMILQADALSLLAELICPACDQDGDLSLHKLSAKEESFTPVSNLSL